MLQLLDLLPHVNFLFISVGFTIEALILIDSLEVIVDVSDGLDVFAVFLDLG
jgi:hypothetical protein